MTLRFLLTIALCVSSVALSAAPKSTKFEQGQKLFASGEVDAALKMLDAAAAESNDAGAVERIQLLRGQCLAARQDFVKAEEAFTMALDANPEASLDPARVDPTVVKLLESVRSRLSGPISLNSEPLGATVSIDGRQMGKTPLNLNIPLGRHSISLSFGEIESPPRDVIIRAKRDVYVDVVKPASAVKAVEVPQRWPAKIRAYGDIRGTLEAATTGDGALFRGGLDVGGGFELRYFRLGLYARLFPYFGLSPRAAFVLPVIDNVTVFLEGHIPFWFRGGGVALGIGGSGGVEYAFLPFLGGFAQIGGEHLFLNPGYNDSTHFLAQGGVRLRMP